MYRQVMSQEIKSIQIIKAAIRLMLSHLTSLVDINVKIMSFRKNYNLVYTWTDI